MITRRDFLKVTAAGGVLASMGSVREAKAAMRSAMPDEQFCYEGERKVPLLMPSSIIILA